MYINDLPDRWTNENKFYADDGKLVGRDIDTNDGVQKVQADLDAASDRNDKWIMQLNDKKCAVVHMGKQNPQATYTIRKPEGEKDLGVTVGNELSFSEHIRAATAKPIASSVC